MTTFGDQARIPDIVAKDNTADTRLDELSVQRHVEITGQDENTNKYETPANVGNKTPGVYWDDENAPGSSTYPPAIADNRSINASDYMLNNTPSNSETRTLGEWSDCTPCVARDNGIAPIREANGNVDPNLEAKEAVNGAISDDPSKIKNILGYSTPKGMPGIAVQSANQSSHQNLFVPAGGILTTSEGTQNGMSTRVVPVDDDGWLETGKTAALDSLVKVNNDEDGKYIPTINATLSTNDDSGYGAMTFGDNNLAYLSNEIGGPIHPGFDSDKHAITPNTSGHSVNPAHIDTNAYFAMDATRDSKLNFVSDSMPTLTELSNPDGYTEAKIYHDNIGSPTGDRWRVIVPYMAGQAAIYARIRWNFTVEEDLSEAELLEYDQATDTWSELDPAEQVWIDTNLSLAAKFETAGDNTIFSLQLIETDVERDEVTRDLYAVINCIDDRGSRITHFETATKQTSNRLEGLILSEDLLTDPWTNVTTSKIQTTIDETAQDNNWVVRVPSQWDLTGGEDYAYMEFSDLSRSIPWFTIPIEPIFDGGGDEDAFESAEQVTSTTIASYRIA